MYSPKGGSNPGGPGPNALAMPAQQQTAPIGNNSLAGNYGTGLMQGAADIKKQYPIWQQQYMEGTTTLQFPDWLKGQQGQTNPAMPTGSQQTGQNSMSYGPRGYG